MGPASRRLRGATENSSQLQATAAYCDPTLTDPPQLCPGGVACPNCGSNSCACPTGPIPSPTPPAPGNCQAFDHKNSTESKIYGSLTPTNVGELLTQMSGIPVRINSIEVPKVEEIGTYTVTVKLSAETKAIIPVDVVPEGDGA